MSKMTPFLIFGLFLLQQTAQAACEEPAQSSADKMPVISEIALANMIIYSQEYMRYFFADNDSEVQPLPASGISLFLARYVQEKRRISGTFTLPLREEEIRRPNTPATSYYYPKLAMFGIEQDLLQTNLSRHQYCFKVSAGAGLSLVLSDRFLKYAPPFLLIRSAAEVGENVYLNFGIGYSGNIKSGAWFFPFGISYRLVENR